MTSRRTSQNVPFSAEQMYALVADIEAYPRFIPWCAALRVVAKDVDGDGNGNLLADMVVAYKVFREKFRSKVDLDPEEKRITAAYTDGPFKSLNTIWTFTDNPDGGSTVDFSIDFQFKNMFLQSAAGAVFEKAFSRMSDAFISRAHALYGA